MINKLLFPGFVTSFKDVSGYTHLYFFPGIDNKNKYYYNELDLSNSKIKYNTIKHDDGALEYVFLTKKTIRITCKLVSNENEITNITV